MHHSTRPSGVNFRRLHGRMCVGDERLKRIALTRTDQVRDYDPIAGGARLIPERGVVLVITDERGSETVFGFLQFQEKVSDINGSVCTESGFGKSWARF